MDYRWMVAFVMGAVVFTAWLGLDIHFAKKQKLDSLKSKSGLGEAPSSNDYYTPDGSDNLAEMNEDASPMAASFEALVSGFVNMDSYKRTIRPQLAQAGINSADAPIYLLLYKWLFGPIVALLGVFVCLNNHHEGTVKLGIYLAGGLIALLGAFGTQLYISNARQKRQKELIKAFPDTLDLLVVCVESGLALDAALNRVCAELGRAYPTITEELNRTRLELALLNDRSRALQNLAERTDLVPFRSLVASLLQTEKFGTSLTDTLRVLSDDYRHTRLMIAENKAGRLPALMTIPLICFLLPALFIIIMAPPFIRIARQGGFFGTTSTNS